MAYTIWDDIQVLDRLEKQRDQRRKNKTHLTFDCFEAKVKGDRVACAKGKSIGRGKDGTMYLSAVLKGTTSSVCETCADYLGD